MSYSKPRTHPEVRSPCLVSSMPWTLRDQNQVSPRCHDSSSPTRVARSWAAGPAGGGDFRHLGAQAMRLQKTCHVYTA